MNIDKMAEYGIGDRKGEVLHMKAIEKSNKDVLLSYLGSKHHTVRTWEDIFK